MRIQKFEVVESTNDLARKYILEGNKEPVLSWQSIKLGQRSFVDSTTSNFCILMVSTPFDTL